MRERRNIDFGNVKATDQYITAKECGRAIGRKELEEILIEQNNKSRATQQPSLLILRESVVM